MLTIRNEIKNYLRFSTKNLLYFFEALQIVFKLFFKKIINYFFYIPKIKNYPKRASHLIYLEKEIFNSFERPKKFCANTTLITPLINLKLN